MDAEDRIAALENRVAELEKRLTDGLRTVAQVTSYAGGSADAFHNAVLAMIGSAPPNPLFDRMLSDFLARGEAIKNAVSLVEEVVRGYDESQGVILSQAEYAKELYAGDEGAPG